MKVGTAAQTRRYIRCVETQLREIKKVLNDLTPSTWTDIAMLAEDINVTVTNIARLAIDTQEKGQS